MYMYTTTAHRHTPHTLAAVWRIACRGRLGLG